MAESPLLILMLEDESDRLIRFDAVISKLGTAVEWRHWRTAEDFIVGFKSAGRVPGLICLDHDLFTDHPDDPDPGDGREVAEFLATQTPCCHVIIHSSNSHAADSMFFTLSDAKWDVEKIAPLGQDWIESYWWDTAKPWIKNAK
ncbi:MAG: cyclic-phosphate processing receiver domain-containing protein [Planctomycetota bacterium]